MPHPYVNDIDADGYCHHCGLPERHPGHGPTVRPERIVAEAYVPSNGTATSNAAANLAQPRRGTQQFEVLRIVAARGDYGATDFEIESLWHGGATKGKHQSVSSARNGAVARGFLARAMDAVSGEPITRLTDSNRAAQVWVLTPAGRDVLGQGIAA